MRFRPLNLEPWEIEAMRELVDITSLLNDGMFSNPADLAARIKATAEAIELVLPTIERVPPTDDIWVQGSILDPPDES